MLIAIRHFFLFKNYNVRLVKSEWFIEIFILRVLFLNLSICLNIYNTTIKGGKNLKDMQYPSISQYRKTISDIVTDQKTITVL